MLLHNLKSRHTPMMFAGRGMSKEEEKNSIVNENNQYYMLKFFCIYFYLTSYLQSKIKYLVLKWSMQNKC